MVNPNILLPVRRTRPGEETQEKAWRVLLRSDFADCGGAEEDAAYRSEHVHPRRPGAHLSGQDALPAGKMCVHGSSLGASKPEGPHTVYDQQKDTDEEVKDHIQQNLHLREKVSVDTGSISANISQLFFVL